MRNLKRALSLTLASVMLLGMMVFGTSAASFTDADDISNVTAATVLQDLKIMQGSNGKFSPNQTVTRGQMAIIICKMLYGSNLNVNQFAGSQQFDDVPAGQYYTGYVNLAASLGIISGYGNGKFGPGAPVSTAQAALMLCRALGYFQAGELEGKGWGENALTAITQATKLGLFGELKLDTNAPLSRDNVAEMSFNALTKVTPVQYNETWKMYYTDSESMFTGVKFQYDETLGYRNYELVYTTKNDDFGRPTTVWGYGQLKNAGPGTSYLKDNGDIDTDVFTITNLPATSRITEVANKPTASYDGKVSRATLYDLVGRSAVGNLDTTSTTGTPGAADSTPMWRIISDGQELSRNKTEVFAQNDSTCIGRTGAGATSDLTGAGSHTDVYINSNGEVTIAISNTYLLQATGDYSSRTNSVTTTAISNNGDKTSAAISYAANELTLSGEDFNIADVKMDDYLLVTVAGSTASNKEIKSVKPATVVTGKVDRFGKGDEVYIAGTKYGYGFTADNSTSHGKAVEYAVGEDTSVVVDSANNILYVDEVTIAAGRYVYIREIARAAGNFTDNKYVANAYFLDGTNKTINISDKYKDESAVSAVTPNTWYRYTVNSSDKYTLEALSTGNKENNHGTASTDGTNGAKLIESGKVRVGSGGAIVNANDATIFVIRNSRDEVKAYTGIKNVPTIQASTATAISAEFVRGQGGFAKYIFVDAYSNTSVKGAASSDYIYILKTVHEGIDGGEDSYDRFQALVNGQLKKDLDVNTDVSATVGTLYANVIYNDKGYVTDMDPVSSTEDFVPEAGSDYKWDMSNATVYYGESGLNIGGKAYTVNASTEIYLIARDSNIKVDDGADYLVVEDGKITPQVLYSTLRNYLVTGSYYLRTDGGAEKDVVKAMYILVTGTTKAGGAIVAIEEGSTGAEVVTELNKAGVTKVSVPNADLSGGMTVPSTSAKDINLTGDITGGGNITGGHADGKLNVSGSINGTTDASSFAGQMVIAGNTEVKNGTTLTLPANTKLEADLVVKTGAVVSLDKTVAEGSTGKISLDGGTLKLTAGQTTELPKVVGNGIVEVTDGKTIETPGTPSTPSDYLDDLQAKLPVAAPTSSWDSDTNTLTFTVDGSNTVGVKGNSGKVESWSGTVDIATMAGRTGGNNNSKVIFIKLTIPAGKFTTGQTVEVKYTTTTNSTPASYNSNAEWTLTEGECAGTTSIIIPVTDNVNSISLVLKK